jgi:hypothetical protein
MGPAGANAANQQNRGRGSDRGAVRGRQGNQATSRPERVADYFSSNNQGRGSRGRQQGRGSKYHQHDRIGNQGNFDEYNDNSDDDDLKRLEYEKLSNEKGYQDVNQTKIADYFESSSPRDNHHRSRSLSRSFQKSGDEREKIVDMFEDVNYSEKPSFIEPLHQKEDFDSEEEFEKSMAKHKEDQMNLLMSNAQQTAIQQKKPKKGKGNKDAKTTSNVLLNYESGKAVDDGTGMDWKSRIAGAIVEDYQRSGQRKERNGSLANNSFSDSKRSQRLIKTKFIGLTEKFEYGKMLKSGNDMFRVHQILKMKEEGGDRRYEYDMDELNKEAGAGKMSPELIDTQKTMLMQFFQLFGMYSSHYSAFNDRRFDVTRNAIRPRVSFR